MRIKAIRVGDGWYIPKVQALDYIKSDIVELEVIEVKEIHENLKIENLRDVVLLERYFEKQSREDLGESEIEYQQTFRELMGLKALNFREALKEV